MNAPNAGFHAYVRGLKIDGAPWQKDWLRAKELLGRRHGGAITRLDYSMAAQPDRAWGASAEDRPPSWGAIGNAISTTWVARQLTEPAP